MTNHNGRFSTRKDQPAACQRGWHDGTINWRRGAQDGFRISPDGITMFPAVTSAF